MFHQHSTPASSLQTRWVNTLLFLMGFLTLLALASPTIAHQHSSNHSHQTYTPVALCHLRATPMAQSPLLQTLVPGEDLTLLITEGAWAKVRTLSGTEGFVPISKIRSLPERNQPR